jgi:hypothetical protein
MDALKAFPLFGFVLHFLSIFISVPFYILWHYLEMRTFFYFLPERYLNIGFIDTVLLFLTISLIKVIIFPVSFSTKIETKVKKD